MDEIHRLVRGRYEARLVPSNEAPAYVRSQFHGKELGYTVEELIARLGGRSGEVEAPDGTRCGVSIDPSAPDTARYVISYSFIPDDRALFDALVREAFGSPDGV